MNPSPPDYELYSLGVVFDANITGNHIYRIRLGLYPDPFTSGGNAELVAQTDLITIPYSEIDMYDGINWFPVQNPVSLNPTWSYFVALIWDIDGGTGTDGDGLDLHHGHIYNII